MLEKIEKSTQEQKEKEQLPILFMYRDNDAFQEEMPEIIKNLQAWGRKVESQVFPQGTDKKEIKKWVQSNQDDMVGKEIVSDWTVAFEIDTDLKEKLEKQGANFSEKLDSIFGDATDNVVFGNLREEVDNPDVSGISEKEQGSKKEFYRAEKGIERILQNYFKRGGPLPKSFYILKSCLYQHEPFYHYAAYEEITNAQKTNPDQADKIREKYQQSAAETVKKWLVGAGIPEDVIHIEGNVTEKNRHDLVRPGTWFIGDRHNLSQNYKGQRLNDMFISRDEGSIIYNDQSGSCKRANIRTFLLPFGDFYRTAKEQGFLDVDKQEFRKVLNEKFKKLFMEQVEEE